MNVRTTTLERMTVAAQRYISAALVADFGIAPDVHIEKMMWGDIAITVRQHVYGEKIGTTTVRYPATWRDAVKDRLYAWLRSGHWPLGADLLEPRYPVKWQQVTTDVTALYPKISMPHERHSIQVAQVRDEDTDVRRLWFDATGRNLFDLLYRLYSEGRTGREWHCNYPVFYEIAKLRTPMGEYITGVPTQVTQTIMGMLVKIDRTVPNDTLELRDKDDRIVGKIYNIG